MSRIKVAAFLLLAACVGAAGSQAFARQKPGDPPIAVKAERGKSAAAKWRYKLVRLVGESQLADEANREAENGWEVDQVVVANPTSNQFTILMRQSADLKD